MVINVVQPTKWDTNGKISSEMIKKIKDFFSNKNSKLTKPKLEVKSGLGPIEFWESLKDKGLISYTNNNFYDKLWVLDYCRRLISENVGRLPIQLENSSGESLNIRDNDITLKLFINPNQLENGFELTRRISSDIITRGNAYIYSLGEKTPMELTPLYAKYVEPMPTQFERKTDVSYYRYTYVTTINYSPEEIIHIKTYNELDRTKGVSWVRAGMQQILRLHSLNDYNVNMFENGVFPSINFSTPELLNNTQRDELDYWIKKKYKGARKAGGHLITDSGLKAEKMNYNPVDLELIKNENITTAHIATMHHVPPEMLGAIVEKKNVATYVQAREQFMIQGVLPLADLIYRAINKYFWPNAEFTLSVNKNMIDVLKPTSEELQIAWWMTGNEKRLAQGLMRSEDDNMDRQLVPSNLILLEDLIAESNEEI